MQVEKYNILHDNSNGKNVLQAKLKSISDKAVNNVFADIECYDAANDEVGTVKDVLYTVGGIKKGGIFGAKQAINTGFSNVGKIKIIMTKVVFEDESVWRNESNQPLEEYEGAEAKKYLNDYALYEQYMRECNKIKADSRYVITTKDDVWICSCGQPNPASTDKCYICGADKAELIKISDKNYLSEELRKYNEKQESIRLYQEEEARRKEEAARAEDKRRALIRAEQEQLAAEKKKKQLKLLAVGAAAVCIIAVLAFTANYFMKSSKYNKATELMAQEKYSEAEDIFTSLGDFKDSQKLAFTNKVKINNYPISAGFFHTIGLKADGSVVAIGANNHDQRDVSDWSDIVAVSAGAAHTVGLKANGTVVAVGYNDDGQCDVSDWSDIVAVSAGDLNTVGLRADGSVVAVGNNECGQCDVSDWSDIVAVSAGLAHTVGLKADGSVVAVGNNECGQCDVSDWSDIVTVSAGGLYTVGLRADGSVVAVGYNDDGQCDVSGWSDIVAVSAGVLNTVGLRSDGSVVAVGNNEYGQCDVSDWSDIGK